MRHVLLIFALLLASPALAQNVRTAAPGAAPPKAAIEDIAWIAGHWEGEGLGGQSIETISPPVGGQMSGHFQQLDKGKLQFYELYQFVPVGGSLLMRIKHFGPDLKGWEEKDVSEEFPLVAIEKDAVYFDGLTMRRVGADGMETTVRIGEKDGSTRDAVFRFKRKAL